MVLLLLALISSLLVAIMAALFKFSTTTPISTGQAKNKSSTNRRYTKTRSATAEKASYVPFSEAAVSGAVVVDCTHPSAPTFTHHKSARNPDGLTPADTSTGLVLNALLATQSESGASLFPGWLDCSAVTVNHFDGDALFSVWAFINRIEALKHDALLRCAAALHDFREVPLEDTNNKSGSEASLTLARQALALCCWINTIERAQFTPPFEESDADEKFAFFLEELGKFLENPEGYKNIWQEEYDQVLEDYKLIEEQGMVTKYPEIGVAIVRCPRPVHYYALFSHTLGCDVVVSEYIDSKNTLDNFNEDGNTTIDASGWRYEVEEKYTQFVNVWSRSVTARLDMTPLAAFLNEVDSNRAEDCDWASPRLIDSGPLLRLDSQGKKLLKSQRYGHPTARPMHASGLSPEKFENIILSFFKFGLQGVEKRVGGFSWDELHQINANNIDWEAWKTQMRA